MHHYQCVVAVQRHQSAERPILHQISSLMYPKIQRRQVIMNVLHPGCAWPPRWSPPVLWRGFEDSFVCLCLCVYLRLCVCVYKSVCLSVGCQVKEYHRLKEEAGKRAAAKLHELDTVSREQKMDQVQPKPCSAPRISPTQKL